MFIARNEAIKKIKAALKIKTGKVWSVTGGRGTAYGWITVQAPPKRRVNHIPNPDFEPWMDMRDMSPSLDVEPKDGEKGHYTSAAECEELGEVFGLSRPAHCQGVQISPDDRERMVMFLEEVR